MTSATIPFNMAFQALTDHPPLLWQQRLFAELSSGQTPRICNLPTGLGKTSVIPIWLVALAKQAQEGTVTLPRRLVYIINRRTVVDQATRVVEQIRQRLLTPDDAGWSKYAETLRSLASALQRLASTEHMPLAVSTLRGELADNEEWKADPARPAIIIGTIDMIGSKLLFSGYGDGRYWRTHHAGLIGQDSLIVHDEAHLTPAFGDLLHGVADAQRRSGEPRPVQVLELSATSRGTPGPIFGLELEDEKDQVVKDRLDAMKALHIDEVRIDPHAKYADVAEKISARIAEIAASYKDAQAKVLIYVSSPEDASYVVDKLKEQLSDKKQERIALLTGTIRGYERDKLDRENPVYKAFLNPDPNVQVGQAVYLVSTSAGEVGIDIDADHMVCDLTTLDSMIQRLGRVNRRGGHGRKARVDVVVRGDEDDAKDDASKSAKATTRAILLDWAKKSKNGAIDVSPRNLGVLLDNLDEQHTENAFAPKSEAPLLTDVLLDAWSLTSITEQMPGRLEVASYLHGLANDPPETYLAWRKEVAFLAEAKIDPEVLREWFQACRIEAHERLRDHTARVKEKLKKLLRTQQKDFPVVLLTERGEAQWSALSKIVEKEFNLDYRTVILPSEAGGLNEQGALDAKETGEATDVAEQVISERRRERWLLTRDAGGERYERLVNGAAAESLPSGLIERERVSLQQSPEGAEEEEYGRHLLLMVLPKQSALDHAETAKIDQTLSFHLRNTADHMNQITGALGLQDGIKEALAIAAEWHDRGKDRPIWQWYAYNSDGVEPLAKSKKYRDRRLLGGYRHEFGSMLEAAAEEKIQKHAEVDLILHLIAAHHGWARPHFERNALDNTRTSSDNEEAVAEAMRRFGRLQQRFGRWGLAWLESLVRCADIAASKTDIQPLTGGGRA